MLTPGRSSRESGQEDADVVLEVRGLTVKYGYGEDSVTAVNDFDLNLERGEILGIVGESGSGKSTLAYAIMRLLREPAHVDGGSVLYHRKADGATSDLLLMSNEELRALRWVELAIVFQSAMNALNPVLTLETQVADVLRAHNRDLDRSARHERVGQLLEMVGIPKDRRRSYPHELSGGMRQRSLIAIALALNPDVLIMDEPTTALDVVTQRQVLREILQLRERFGFSVIFITHDLALIMEIADRVVVMYAGRTVEMGRSIDLLHTPRHPYTIGLLNSFPTLHGEKRMLSGIPGSPPNQHELPTGCAFHPRCPQAKLVCTQESPPMTLTGVSGDRSDRRVRCWLYGGNEQLDPELREEISGYGS